MLKHIPLTIIQIVLYLSHSVIKFGILNEQIINNAFKQ